MRNWFDPDNVGNFEILRILEVGLFDLGFWICGFGIWDIYDLGFGIWDFGVSIFGILIFGFFDFSLNNVYVEGSSIIFLGR